jgi:signal peptidase II
VSSDTHTPQGRLRTRVAVFVCLAALLIALDQITKYFAVRELGGGQSRTVIPNVLTFRLLYNPGATLGMGSGATWIISIAAAAASVILLVLALRTVRMAWTVALTIAFAGAAGNLIDRVVHATGFLNGKVTDFLDYGWSVGNVADVYLSVAAVIIVVLVMRSVPFLREGDPGSTRQA